MPLNRIDLQQLADIRIAEAQLLLAHGSFDGAYYLAGYAVECALKACIARLTNQHDFPDKQFANRCFSHDIEDLVVVAGIKTERDGDADLDPDLSSNWGVVKDWNEQSRYTRNTQAVAQGLIDAITDGAHGVLPWIKQRW